MFMLNLLPFVLLPSTTAMVPAPREIIIACNNSPSLCSKSYGEITHLGAHDSPFLRDASTAYSTSGNQFYNTTVQLSAGVRLLTAQVHKVGNGAWHLCHTSCQLLDAGTLESWLREIGIWLEKNPHEVITIVLVNSDDATASKLGAVFMAADFVKFTYIPSTSGAAPNTWPTLQEMIDAGTRVVVFVASLSSNTDAPYLMDEFTYIFENNYDVTSASRFSCQPHRPRSIENDIPTALSSNRLPFMNHFLDTTEGFGIQTPDVSAVDVTNAPIGKLGNLGDAAAECKSQYSGRQPTFILVDFVDRGPAIDTVDWLNNVTMPVGRKRIPRTNLDDSTHSSSRRPKGLTDLVNQVRNGANPSIGNWIWVGGNWGNLLGGGILL